MERGIGVVGHADAMPGWLAACLFTASVLCLTGALMSISIVKDLGLILAIPSSWFSGIRYLRTRRVKAGIAILTSATMFSALAIGVPLYSRHGIIRAAELIQDVSGLERLAEAAAREGLPGSKREAIRRIYADELYIQSGDAQPEGTSLPKPSEAAIQLRRALEDLRAMPGPLMDTALFWSVVALFSVAGGVVAPVGRRSDA